MEAQEGNLFSCNTWCCSFFYIFKKTIFFIMKKLLEFIVKHLVQLIASLLLGATTALVLVKQSIITGDIGILTFMVTSYLFFKIFVFLKRKIFYPTMAILFLSPMLLMANDGSFIHDIDWQALVNVLFTVLVVAFPTLFIIFKGKISKIRSLVETLDDAVKDGRLTKDEIGYIVQKFKDIF